MASWAEDDFFVEDDERENAQMSDKEHLLAFGWAWDDPNRVQELA